MNRLSQGRPDLKIQYVGSWLKLKYEDGNHEIAGHGPGCGGKAAFGRTLSRWEYPETGRVGDCFGSLGPAAFRGR